MSKCKAVLDSKKIKSIKVNKKNTIKQAQNKKNS